MKNIYKIIIGLVILTPTVVFGAITPTGINQGNGFINPIRIGDRIEAAYFIASSTTSTTTLTNATVSNRLFVATTTDTLWGGRHPIFNAAGTVTIGGNLTVGSQPPTYADDNLSIADFTSNVDNYSFVGIQNKSTGINASADLVFGNALTTASDYYFDCGMAGSDNNTAVYPGLGPAHWGYCFSSDAGLSMGIATTTTGADFRWVTGADSLLNTDIKMVLTNAGNLGVGTTSPRWKLQAAATTSPQLVLTSNGTTESHWGFRNAGGYMYITTINPVTFATSTNPNLSLSPLSSVVAVGTSTFPAGVQLAIAAGSNPVPVMYDSINSTGMYNIYRNSNVDMGYIGSAASLFPSSGGLRADFAIRGSGNLTLGVGAGEDMRVAPTGFVGIGTTSPYARLSVVGETVASHFTATSTTATSTFAGGVDFRNATVQQKLALKFGIATTTAWTGTTTRQLGPMTTLQTWRSATCYTTVGTLNVVFSNGTNSTNMIQASTTPATFAITTNGRFVAGSKSQVSVGTPASSPTEISCTIDYISNI